MKRILIIITTAVLCLNPFTALADEGMWLLMLLQKLNMRDMQAKGFKLTADEIYSLNKASLKDAIVMLNNGGCTAEAISDQGLILTNHHCGYGAIQANSSVDKDYLTNGFWAYDLASDLPSPGYTASFLVRMDDVTARINNALKMDMDEATRNKVIAEEIAKIEKESTEGTTYNAKVRGFFENAEFYLFVYETFTDVRLVGAPPSSIGKFGGDTDNWMWPRHTGDFTLMRVYSGKDGKPAAYSKDNVPYKPKRSLAISLDGVNDKDFTMVMGNPGRTDRYLTSNGVRMLLEQTAPSIVKIRTQKLDILKADMDANPKVKIQYASKYASTANYWKYYIGQDQQLRRNRVLDKKLKIEDDFNIWATRQENETKDKVISFVGVVDKINGYFDDLKKYNLHRTYVNECFVRTVEFVPFALGFAEVEKLLADNKTDDAKKKLEDIRNGLPDQFKNYNAATDKKLLVAMLTLFKADVPADQQPDIIKSIETEFGSNYQTFADALYSSSIFVDEAKMNDFIANPTADKLKNDWGYRFATAVVNNYRSKYAPEVKKIEENQDRYQRLFINGLRLMNASKPYAPDANGTIRLTYGNIKSYYPQDGVFYDYYTTLDGVIAKEDSTNEEFIVPKKLKELYNKKDFGKYADSKGRVVTCFISNNDITGGNSGSPVLNAYGELVGCAFDGNWEAMSGDIYFDPEFKRTISVDIRYVLFIVDKYANAQNLIKEMKLVSRKGKK